MITVPTPSALTRKLHDLLFREAHLTRGRELLAPLLTKKESELRAVQAARPTFSFWLSPKKRRTYSDHLSEAKDVVAALRTARATLERCEVHLKEMIEGEIEGMLRQDCPDYTQALAAKRQKEVWERCVERFATKIFEFTRALGNARNMACSGYVRHAQAYSESATQALNLAHEIAQHVEDEVKFANKIADMQLQLLQESGIQTKPLPHLPVTGFSAWVSKIISLPLVDAQLEFDKLIGDMKRLHETGITEMRALADEIQHTQETDIRNFLLAAWEQFRSEVANEIYPGDTDRVVAETEQMLMARAKSGVLGRM